MRIINKLLFAITVLIVINNQEVLGQNENLNSNNNSNSANKTPDKPNNKISKLSFVGGADIQRAVTEGGDLPASTGVGIIYNRAFQNDGKIKLFQNMNSYIYVNVASTADTIFSIPTINIDSTIGLPSNVNEFGDYILLPINSKQSASVFFKGYFYSDSSRKYKRKVFRNILDMIDGVQFVGLGSNRTFVVDSITAQSNNSMSLNASIVSFRLGIFHEFIPNDDNRINYSITFGIDFSERLIFGDLGQNSNKDLRKKLIGTEKKAFFGIEPYVSFRLRNIIAEILLPTLWPMNNEDVPGLTNTRMITSLKIVGGFPLEKKQ